MLLMRKTRMGQMASLDYRSRWRQLLYWRRKSVLLVLEKENHPRKMVWQQQPLLMSWKLPNRQVKRGLLLMVWPMAVRFDPLVCCGQMVQHGMWFLCVFRDQIENCTAKRDLMEGCSIELVELTSGANKNLSQQIWARRSCFSSRVLIVELELCFHLLSV